MSANCGKYICNLLIWVERRYKLMKRQPTIKPFYDYICWCNAFAFGTSESIHILKQRPKQIGTICWKQFLGKNRKNTGEIETPFSFYTSGKHIFISIQHSNRSKYSRLLTSTKLPNIIHNTSYKS